MKRLLAVCFVLCAFASRVSGRAQESGSVEDEDYSADNADIVTHPLTFSPIINQAPVAVDAAPAPLEVAKHASQCLYDFKGKRVNKDCASEKPPKCEKGHLVSTSVGEDYEMCCCNYSNFL